MNARIVLKKIRVSGRKPEGTRREKPEERPTREKRERCELALQER